ncbi:retrovirus-related pol polyprotein from transposon TNT 1-94 [Tanacetum coccineum]|uniref:Retrovirus-related pol polyprotein from transposon TNT 1-94 n=1 Tax=Tanacetum coccineum TaxID=301880 RepID=A0ABQ5BT58_9ASTR
MYITSLKRSENYKAQPYQYASSSKQILREKAKPFPPCIHCGFNDHMPGDYRNYPECEIYGSYDYSTSRHNRVIQIRGGVLAESSQANESSIRVKCNTCGSTVYSTSDHNEFDHFKRDTSGRPSGTWTVDAQGLSHLNFKNINKLAKQNKVLGLPSLVYSKDKPCTTCEKGKHHRASFKTKQNFSIRKCLHILHMDLFGLVSPMSINHEKYTLVIVDEYSRMVENQNDVKVKQIRTNNRTEFRNHELESFCVEKGISQNFSSPSTPEQNGVAERRNRTLIESARTMLNRLVLSKHFWTDAVRTACYTQNRSTIVKRHDKTSYEIFRERIHDISYFHVFGCPVFIHNHKDHLGKFDAKADDGYFLGYSSVSKAFRVYNTRRQQIEETYHVTCNESMEAIKFTNTSVDEIGIGDSSRYPPDEFEEDDPSRKYQVDSDVLYYIIPHG